MKRIALHTLGCKLNYAETAAIGKRFTGNGYTVVGIDDPADVVVINSCSVTSHADRECRRLIRRALRHSPDAFVAVVGCYAQLQAEQIAGISGVDLVLGSQDKFSLFDFITDAKKKSKPDIFVSCIDNDIFEPASSAGFKERTRAFLKVQDGCDYNCSYCTIPLARGKSRSTTVGEIVRQAREAVEQGYKEVVLTGVNVGDYGKNSGTDLLTLLKQLDLIDGLMRIRISSVEPNLIGNELLDYWFASEKLCKHWHIPLQSGSDEILRSMQRRYRKNAFEERIKKIKMHVPDAGIGTDVIVGFPGERDELFRETYDFLNDLPVTYIHVFSYSERPNTPAVKYMEKINARTRGERSKELHRLSARKRRAFYDSFIGRIVPVLFESMHSDGTLSGLTEEYIRVDVKTEKNLTNRIGGVMIEEATAEKCTGTIAEPDITRSIRIAV